MPSANEFCRIPLLQELQTGSQCGGWHIRKRHQGAGVPLTMAGFKNPERRGKGIPVGTARAKLEGTDTPGVSGGQVEGPWGEIVELHLERWVGPWGGSGDEIVHLGSLGVLERRECCLSRGVAASGGLGESFSSRGVD